MRQNEIRSEDSFYKVQDFISFITNFLSIFHLLTLNKDKADLSYLLNKAFWDSS
jgi:hypothetical protein